MPVFLAALLPLIDRPQRCPLSGTLPSFRGPGAPPYAPMATCKWPPKMEGGGRTPHRWGAYGAPPNHRWGPKQRGCREAALGGGTTDRWPARRPRPEAVQRASGGLGSRRSCELAAEERGRNRSARPERRAERGGKGPWPELAEETRRRGGPRPDLAGGRPRRPASGGGGGREECGRRSELRQGGDGLGRGGRRRHRGAAGRTRSRAQKEHLAGIGRALARGERELCGRERNSKKNIGGRDGGCCWRKFQYRTRNLFRGCRIFFLEGEM